MSRIVIVILIYHRHTAVDLTYLHTELHTTFEIIENFNLVIVFLKLCFKLDLLQIAQNGK
jgi:hypothetical protein